MCWRLVLEEFGPNIQHIAGVDNIVADMLGRLMSTPGDKNKSCTRKAQCRANELFAIGMEEKNEYYFPLNLLVLQREQQNELRNINSRLSTYISDQGSSYYMQELNNVKIICYDSKYTYHKVCADVY